VPTDRIRLDYKALADITRSLEHEADDIDKLTQQITRCAEQLYAQGWRGRSADAFYREMAEVVFPATRRLSALLRQCGETNTQVTGIFQQADTEVGQLFRKGLISGNYRLERPGNTVEDQNRWIDTNEKILHDNNQQLTGLNYLDNLLHGKLPGYEAVRDDMQKLIQTERSQLALDKIKNIDGIQPDVWKTLSPDERRATLLQVHEAYAEAYGMQPAKLEFGTIPQGGQGVATPAYYDPATKTMYVDDRLIAPTYLSPENAVPSLVGSVVHESRHALQHQVIDDPGKFDYISQTQVNVWRDDFAKSIDPNESYERYQNQPVEADAFKAEGEVEQYVFPRHDDGGSQPPQQPAHSSDGPQPMIDWGPAKPGKPAKPNP
jgi:WXG100 family type VII secretion target